ncbi:MAG: hypothetical protein KIT84_31390 [Labilithrix sp.]|nr:hypothetical protein [Labilithrix sp.]MCW5815574.1 hypothetical protein [Labilithrix sp.]
MFRRIAAVVVATAALVVPSLALAGNTTGPATRFGVVDAHKSANYSVTLRGGENATILVKGDGHADLDCYLEDENGNVVARDIDSTDSCLLSMTPKWTGQFRVEVRNMGKSSNRYLITTN